MSYQEPETTPQNAPTGAGAPGAPVSSTPLLDALIARNLLQLPAEVRDSATPLEGFPQLPNPDPNSAPPLYGEPPGEGYLYAHDPETRQRAMVSTTPEIVRDMLLRAMETAAQNALLPFNEEDTEKHGRAALAFAQAYLLIDPSVDSEGVSVAGKAAAQAMGQIAVGASQPQPQAAGGAAARPRGGGKGGGSATVVSKGPTVGGHAEPPRVTGSQAANLLKEMHQNLEDVLKGSRGSLPRPRPRVGA